MIRILGPLVAGLLLLSACAPAVTATGPATARAYHLNGQSPAQVRQRMLSAVNDLRAAAGLAPLRVDPALNEAAMAHSADMARQQRPWHFGSDASSPVMRVQRAGYGKELVGENIAETYETELETLAAWMQEPLTREPIMAPEAEDMGLGWFQEPGGKIWWTLITGGGPARTPPTVTPPANTAPPGAPPTVAVEPRDPADEISDAPVAPLPGTS